MFVAVYMINAFVGGTCVVAHLIQPLLHHIFDPEPAENLVPGPSLVHPELLCGIDHAVSEPIPKECNAMAAGIFAWDRHPFARFF